MNKSVAPAHTHTHRPQARAGMMDIGRIRHVYVRLWMEAEEEEERAERIERGVEG